VPPSDPMDRLVRRRHRKHRNQRIGAAVLAIIVAAIGIGLFGKALHLARREEPTRPSPSAMSRYQHNGDLVVVDSTGSLLAVDPTTGAERPLFPGPIVPDGGLASALSFAPDGMSVAYAATRFPDNPSPSDRELGVHVLDLRTGRGGRVFPCRPQFCSRYPPSAVSWSPDGSQLAFAEGGRITLMRPDGSDPRVVLDLGNSIEIEGRPAWSPDGGRIAFATSEASGGQRLFQLWVVGADGSGRSVVTESRVSSSKPSVAIFDPAWSPDGSTIAYDSIVPRAGSARSFGQVWVVRPGGSGRRLLLQTGPACLSICGTGPVWAPDGTEIGWLGPENRLRIMKADGTNPRLLDSRPGGALTWTAVAWRPVP
jgi:Tol biopolymer transport system component